mmetsp:Transcript_38932/g.81443  ORF Transcript_38932/g.81443 Transcript_38932/m.81443 type:complete len:240 (-) Transcript_38932:521-1240(-)
MRAQTLDPGDYFERSWSPIFASKVWVVKPTPIDFILSGKNVCALIGAMSAINVVLPDLQMEEYHVVLIAQAQGADITCTHTVCEEQLRAQGEIRALFLSRRVYWYLAYAVIATAVLLDLGRYFSLKWPPHATNAILGVSSAERESKRGMAPLLLLIPLIQVFWLYTWTLHVPCCGATPLLVTVVERGYRLAFLLLVSCYCLIGDSHNNGYFLLRLPDTTRCAVRLLRPGMAKYCDLDAV